MTKYTIDEIIEMHPKQYRDLVRKGELTGPNHGVCRGYASTDLVVLPKEYAFEFLVFCHRNPRALPVVDITEAGLPHPPRLAPDADLRTDIPRYRVYKDGQVIDEPANIKKYWREDMVAFLLGEASSFHWSWQAANLKHQSKGTFNTNIPLIPAGPFHGNISVACKVFENTHDAVRAIQIASRHPLFHGPPIHIGDPETIGVKDFSNPSLVDPAGQIPSRDFQEGEVAAYWPCFQTVRNLFAKAKIPIAIVDYPLHNFKTDKLAEELAIL
jgi:uncharacterized protein YcsI (UPF0317 family)